MALKTYPAYLYFLLQHIQTPTPISLAVSRIISIITEQAADPSLNLPALLNASGYEDYTYFSRKFKQLTGSSPREYLHSIL